MEDRALESGSGPLLCSSVTQQLCDSGKSSELSRCKIISCPMRGFFLMFLKISSR